MEALSGVRKSADVNYENFSYQSSSVECCMMGENTVKHRMDQNGSRHSAKKMLYLPRVGERACRTQSKTAYYQNIDQEEYYYDI